MCVTIPSVRRCADQDDWDALRHVFFSVVLGIWTFVIPSRIRHIDPCARVMKVE
jgi:hypothetical protein